ncbi:MAG: alpha/beta fold hydrolase [Atopobiaceae bacterium]|nr:alpha/beta fold hydrolase [Atopobiaceae bacterium]
MMPRPPRPYQTTNYAFPAAPLSYAQRLRTPDGASLATFVYGSLDKHAAPVLALHGNGGSHATFAQVIERLFVAGLAVVAFDARAQGQSTRGTARLTYEQMAADAITVLDALDVAKAHVLGHSDGGIEALLLARDHADRVASIVAGGANLTPEGVVDEWDMEGSIASQRAWSEWLQSGDVAHGIDPSLLPSANDAATAAELLQLMLDEPHIDAASLATISCPSCVLVGENDCITRDETESIAAAIPHARLVTVPGVGHSLPRQAPDAVSLQVLTNVLLSR